MGPDVLYSALFAAARAELVATVIRPALERGATVVCDRYLDSSLAYQGIARGLGVGPVLDLNACVSGDLVPDRTFLLDIEPGRAVDRLGAPDRMERQADAFKAAVAQAYRELARRYPDRIVVLDATLPPDAIAAQGMKTTLVADVHTDQNSGSVLEEGTGHVGLGCFVYRQPDGRLVLGAGPVVVRCRRS